MTRTLKPKPWITPTDLEQFDGTFGFNGHEVMIPGVERDADGVLWQPMGEDLDLEGAVRWKDMHTGRQRQAMLEGRCQVCGQLVDRPTSWLIPGLEARAYKPNGRPFTTASPPTCEICISIAKEHCPNLNRYEPLKLTVRNWRPVAVFGDMVDRNGRHVMAEVRLGSPDLARIMARHLVVEVYDYRRVRT